MSEVEQLSTSEEYRRRKEKEERRRQEQAVLDYLGEGWSFEREGAMKYLVKDGKRMSDDHHTFFLRDNWPFNKELVGQTGFNFQKVSFSPSSDDSTVRQRTEPQMAHFYGIFIGAFAAMVGLDWLGWPPFAVWACSLLGGILGSLVGEFIDRYTIKTAGRGKKTQY